MNRRGYFCIGLLESLDAVEHQQTGKFVTDGTINRRFEYFRVKVGGIGSEVIMVQQWKVFDVGDWCCHRSASVESISCFALHKLLIVP